MKLNIRIAPLLVLLLLAAMPAAAQEMPRVEFSAAYALTPQPSSFNLDGADGVTRQGWAASGVVNFNDVFGVDLTGDGTYGTNDALSADVSVHGIMIGPRFTYRESAGIAPFGRALVGPVHRSIDGSGQTFLSGQLGGGITIFTSNHLGFIAGGDYRRNVRGLQWDGFTAYFGISFR